MSNRSITFTIPGYDASEPDVVVHAEEQDGKIHFDLSVVGSSVADIRGLFFDINSVNLLDNLKVEGNDISNHAFDSEGVSNLKNGVNMNGSEVRNFNIGIAFGTPGIGEDDIQSTSFTLSTLDSSALTLDEISQVYFGARLTSVGEAGGNRSDSLKLTTVSLAAPDAIDDGIVTDEDISASSLVSPNSNLLANDTDADGDTLSITKINDSAANVGQEITLQDGGRITVSANGSYSYVPFGDFGGSESFNYTITDANGGTDTATVSIAVAAVADTPLLSVETLSTDNLDEVKLVITSALTDNDGSEALALFLDDVPAGVAVSGATQVGSSSTYTIDPPNNVILGLPDDTDFELTVRARATESTNADTADATSVLDVIYDEKLSAFDRTFLASNQSMWGTGTALGFTDDRFIGLEESFPTISGGASLFGLIGFEATLDLNLKLGLQSTLVVDGGSIDAELPYSLQVDSAYNGTTDILRLDTAALLTGGVFNTFSPSATYDLDLIANANGNFAADITSVLGDATLFDGPFAWNNTVPIIDFDSSEDATFEFDIGSVLSVNLEWPTINTTSIPGGGGDFSSSGQSDNVLQLTVDVDQAIFEVISLATGVPVPNPFDLGFDLFGGGIYAGIELLDFDLFAGMNVFQAFEMSTVDLDGIILFEDGTEQAFTFGDTFDFTSASDVDLIINGGDGNGLIEYQLVMSPDVLMTSDTDLGFNVGFDFSLLEAEAGLDLGIFGQPSIGFGPIFELVETLPLGQINIYDAVDFALNFTPETVDLFA